MASPARPLCGDDVMTAELSPDMRDAALAPLLLKLRARDVVGDEEAEVLRAAISGTMDTPAGRPGVRAHTGLTHSTLPVGGIACRYKDLADGQRQIMELHIAGDFIDLHGFLLKQLDHNVGSITDCRFALVPHDALRRISETQPHLARLLWFSTLLDAAIHREKILSIGRRSALGRIAHLLCELKVRLGLVGGGAGGTYALAPAPAGIAGATGPPSAPP